MGQQGPPSVSPLLPDMKAGWLTTSQLDKYVSFLALWPGTPIVVRVTGKLTGVVHSGAGSVGMRLTHFESGWDDEHTIGVPVDTPVRILARQPTEDEL